ncbi:MAG: acyl-ACP--UDP-N-acetylglucosamine O-acyltransferase [Myxococcota bacterium]
MSQRIHPTADVDPKSEVHPSAEVGAYAVVGPQVRLGEGVVLKHHACVTGNTTVGAGTRIFPFASIGEEPQDQKYHGESSQVLIGERNTFREYVTIHAGTEGGGSLTTIGDDNLFMISAHVAHDCHVGNHVILANQVALGGHITLEDYAVIMGLSGVHQFVRIGESAMVAGMSGVSQDVAPFAAVQGNHARVLGMNRINLERRGFSKERIQTIDRAFRMLFRSGLLPRDAFVKIRERFPDSRDAEHLVAFLEKSERGFCRVR